MFYLVTRNMTQMRVVRSVPDGWLVLRTGESYGELENIASMYNERKRKPRADGAVMIKTGAHNSYGKGDWQIKPEHGGNVLKFYTGMFMLDERGRRFPVSKKFFHVKEGDEYVVKQWIQRKPGKILYHVGDLSPLQTCSMLEDIGVYTADYLQQGDGSAPTSYHRERTQLRSLWSVEFDGKSILLLLAMKPKMSFNDIKLVIENEGGSVDAAGIIHKA